MEQYLESTRRWRLRPAGALCFLFSWIVAATSPAFSQGDYRVVAVTDGGIVSGNVRWSGPVPRASVFPVNKDPEVCDPDGKKTVDLERLVIGPNDGVANTVVYLKNITSGKPLELPPQRRHLDQKHCRYIPHILLVPEKGTLDMQSSDATLHTIHMEGAATYNLPFPFPNRITSRNMPSTGLVHLRCNGGHVWMSAEMFVVRHPYYAVTDENGEFKFTDVPAGTYEIVAWHEGWIAERTTAFDVSSGDRVNRPTFGEPRTWEKSVTVSRNQVSTVDSVISNGK